MDFAFFDLPLAASLRRCVMAPLPTKPSALRVPGCVRSFGTRSPRLVRKEGSVK